MPPNWHILPVSFKTNQRFTGEYSDTLLEVLSQYKLAIARHDYGRVAGNIRNRLRPSIG